MSRGGGGGGGDKDGGPKHYLLGDNMRIFVSFL